MAQMQQTVGQPLVVPYWRRLQPDGLARRRPVQVLQRERKHKASLGTDPATAFFCRTVTLHIKQEHVWRNRACRET